MKQRKSDKQTIEILALSKEPLTAYQIAKRTRLQFSTIHEAIKGKKGLEKRGIVKPSAEQKWRTGLLRKTYLLTFQGLMNFFAFSEKDFKKAIVNYRDLHVFFQYWDKLPKFKLKNIFGGKDTNIYGVLRVSAMETLGYTEWVSFPYVPFESFLPLSEQNDFFKDKFTMVFLRNLLSLNVEINPIPEMYPYVSQVFKNREKDFERVKEFIEKFK